MAILEYYLSCTRVYFLRGSKCLSDILETGAIVAAHLAVSFQDLYNILDYEDQCRCLQEATVETLCKTGHHVGVQIDSIQRFCRLNTPSARGLYEPDNPTAVYLAFKKQFLKYGNYAK